MSVVYRTTFNCVSSLSTCFLVFASALWDFFLNYQLCKWMYGIMVCHRVKSFRIEARDLCGWEITFQSYYAARRVTLTMGWEHFLVFFIHACITLVPCGCEYRSKIVSNSSRQLSLIHNFSFYFNFFNCVHVHMLRNYFILHQVLLNEINVHCTRGT